MTIFFGDRIGRLEIYIYLKKHIVELHFGEWKFYVVQQSTLTAPLIAEEPRFKKAELLSYFIEESSREQYAIFF